MIFAKHAKDCRWCDADRPDFCAALSLFIESGGCAEEWVVLRSKCIPTSASAIGGRMGMTVWQAVCKSEGITNYVGGRYADGKDIPTADAVLSAILYSEVSRAR